MRQSLKALKSSKKVDAGAKGYSRYLTESGRFAQGRKSPRIARNKLKRFKNTIETAIFVDQEDETNSERNDGSRKRRKLIGYDDDESPTNETTDCKIISGRKLINQERVPEDRTSDCKILSSWKGEKEKNPSVVKFHIGSSEKKCSPGKKMKTAENDDMEGTCVADKRIESSGKKKVKVIKKKRRDTERMEQDERVDKRLVKKGKRKTSEIHTGSGIMEENADDGGVVGKINEWFGIRTRSSPLQFFKGISKLQDEQKKAVRRMGFGKLLKFKVDGIPAKLAHYVVDRFKPKRMEIRVPSGRIKVDKESIFKLLGIPNVGLKVSDMEELDEMEPEIAEWKDRYPGRFVAPTSIVKNIQSGEDEDTFNFRLDFLMLFLAIMVECHQQGRCRLKILKKLKADMDFKNIDWCDYVLEGMKKCKRKWRRCDISKTFTGPLTILALLYVESIGCHGMKLDKTLTPIEYWDKNKLKRRETLDIRGGGFGTGKYIRFLENRKSAVEEPDDNVEQFVLSESISELGSLIDSVVKSKSKIEKKLTEVYDNAPENEDVLSIVARYNSVFEVGFKKTRKEEVVVTNIGSHIRDVISGLANELNVHDMDNEDRYSSESDDMDTINEGNCGGSVDKMRDADKGHNEGAEILPASGQATMLVRELPKVNSCKNMEGEADKTGAGQEKGGNKTRQKGSGSVGEITSIRLCTTSSGIKEKNCETDKQGHSEASKKLSRTVAKTIVRKDKSHEVVTKLQVNERVESDGAGEDTYKGKGGVNEMPKGTTAMDDIPSFSMGLSQTEVHKSGVRFSVNEGVQADVTERVTDDTNNLLNEPKSQEKGDQTSMVQGGNDVDDCPTFSLGLSQVENKTVVADSGLGFSVNEGVQADVTVRNSDDTSNLLKDQKSQEKGDQKSMVQGGNDVDDCPTFSLGLSQVGKKTVIADSGAKSGNEERACHFQFIPTYMLEKDHNKTKSEQTSNVNETTKKETRGNKGKNVIGLSETDVVESVTDCGLPTFDIGLTPSEDKSSKEISEGDHSGLEAANLKCRLLAEEVARNRDICISLMEKGRRNPLTERTVRRVDIASNVTNEEDNVWKFIFNNHGFDAADGKQRKSKLKREMKVDIAGGGSKSSSEEHGSDSNRDLEVLFRSAYGVEANRSVFKSLAAKTRVIDEVINCWVEVLNFEERYKEAGSVSRLFVGTKAIIEWMLNAEDTIEEQRMDKFTKNMRAAVYGDDNLVGLESFGLVFFPIVEFDHYYVIVFDLENAIIKVIDNWGDVYPLVRLIDHPDYFSKDSAFKVKHLFVKYLHQVNHPKKDEMEAAPITKEIIGWATKTNLHDCGVFVMRHMENYMGPGKPFDCGFSRNGAKKLAELRRLRTKYAARMLLSDANVLRDKIAAT